MPSASKMVSIASNSWVRNGLEEPIGVCNWQLRIHGTALPDLRSPNRRPPNPQTALPNTEVLWNGLEGPIGVCNWQLRIHGTALPDLRSPNRRPPNPQTALPNTEVLWG